MDSHCSAHVTRTAVRLVTLIAAACCSLALIAGATAEASSLAVPPQQLDYFNSGQAIEPQSHTFADGGRALYFDWSAPGVRPSVPRLLVFVVPGSGCTSMKYFFPGYFSGLNIPARFVALQKRGIRVDGWGDGDECPRDFLASDHPSRTLRDQVEFFEAMRASVPDARVIVIGISEGAEIAADMARSLPSVSALVLIGHGGVAPLTAYQLLLEKYKDKDKSGQSSMTIAAVTSPMIGDNELVHGRSARYWRETFALKTDETLLALPIPIWIAVGERDASMPIEAADLMQQRIARQAHKSIRIVRFPGADHALCAPDRCYMREFFVTLARQLRARILADKGASGL